MHWLDLVVLGLVLLSTLWGLMRGMVREFFSLLGWLGGAALAWRFGPQWIGPLLRGRVPNAWVLPLADFLLFFGVLLLATVTAFFLRGALYSVGFGVPDRLIGAIFGFLRGLVFLAILTFLAQSTGWIDAPWWRASWLGQPQVLSWSQSITAPAVSFWESETRAPVQPAAVHSHPAVD